MHFIPASVYVLLCFLVALGARKRRLGFWLTLVCSFIFTPLLMALVVIVMGPRQKAQGS
jgi:heme/copper-type cytochrome/quinol oxidase subunit 2